MGLTKFHDIPTGEGELVTIEHVPIEVVPSESFNAAKAALDAMLTDAGQLANSIQTDAEYEDGVALISKLSAFQKKVDAGAKPTKDLLNTAKNRLMDFIHQLDEPAAKLKAALSKETARYYEAREKRRREEEERLRREAEEKRRREQRKADEAVLTSELVDAFRAADEAAARGQEETAKEIRKALKKWDAFPSTPKAFADPVADANQVRQVVALAIAHEQARVAQEKALAEGNKKAAKQIEKAAANLAPPVVDQVVSRKVEAEAIVVPKEELSKGKGGYVKKTWRVRAVINADAVPREYLEVSTSKLNDYARRCGEVEPKVPGVQFEMEQKMVGVRG
jgi:hypothetical protein